MFKLKILEEGIKLPTKAHDGDAGFDIYAPFNIHVGYESPLKVPLGFALEVPYGWMVVIQAKSGLANEKGITTIGNIIDCTYRGECHATLISVKGDHYFIKKGEKMCQMLVIPVYCSQEYEVVPELTITERGSGGFGSTGK